MRTANRYKIDFTGKVVLVTGSTRGIGRAIASLFYEYGADVVLNSRNAEDIEGLKSELRDPLRSNVVAGIRADVGKSKEVDIMAEEILREFGKIDIIVNNAGIGRKGFLQDVPEAEWDEVMDINLKGMYNVSKAALPSMREHRSGNIINISSQAVVASRISGIHYTTSKGGVVSFTRGLAVALGPLNIRVNAIMPGIVQTSMNAGIIQNRGYDDVLGKIPLRRLGDSEEVAKTCLYLASDLASYISGTIVAVNGGLPSILFL